MGPALLLIVLALVVGGIALLVTALKWALIVALVLLIAGVVAGWMRRATT